jgi:5-methylcytosine-specific restriction endonuclease McrA
MKQCNTCKTDKPLGDFNKQAMGKWGVKGSCKLCLKTYRDSTKEANYLRGKRWREVDRGRSNAIAARYRAQKKDQTPDMCDMEVSAIRAMYWISDVLSTSCGERFHIDHIKPLSKGGLHEFNNLQILSAEENLSKGGQG